MESLLLLLSLPRQDSIMFLVHRSGLEILTYLRAINNGLTFNSSMNYSKL